MLFITRKKIIIWPNGCCLCSQNITSIVDSITKDVKQRFEIDGFGDMHIFEVNGVLIQENDPSSDISNSMTSLLTGFGNEIGKGIFGSFGAATSIITDVLSGMNMLYGQAHSLGTGHIKNSTNYMGGRNWGLISDGPSPGWLGAIWNFFGGGSKTEFHTNLPAVTIGTETRTVATPDGGTAETITFSGFKSTGGNLT